MKFEELESLGFTKSEVLVYTTLLKIGQSSTGNIVKEAKISSGKIYEVLDKLISKGLVSYILKHNVKYFSAAEPSKIKEYLDKKKKEFTEKAKIVEELLPQLKQIEKGKKPEYIVEVYEGFEGFKTAVISFIDSLKEKGEVFSLGGSGKRPEAINLVWSKVINLMNQKKLKTKMIAMDTSKESIKIFKNFKLKFKTLEGFSLAPLMIGGCQVLIFNFKELGVIVIKNKTIAEQFKFFFESLWKIAKK